VDLVFLLWERIKHVDLKPDENTYGSMINTCCRAGSVEKAVFILEEMQRQGIKPAHRHLVPIIKRFMFDGNFTRAETLFDSLSPEDQRSMTSLKEWMLNQKQRIAKDKRRPNFLREDDNEYNLQFWTC